MYRSKRWRDLYSRPRFASCALKHFMDQEVGKYGNKAKHFHCRMIPRRPTVHLVESDDLELI